MNYEAFIKEVETDEIRNGVMVQTSEGVLMVEGIIVDGQQEAGTDYEGAYDEMDSQTGIVVIDPSDDHSYMFVDHYEVDCTYHG